MGATKPDTREPLGVVAMRVRMAHGLTRQKLADMAGVREEDVHLFEHNLPLYLDGRRKIMKALWAAKGNRQIYFLPPDEVPSPLPR